MEQMKIGDSYEVTRTVTEEVTAAAAGSGGLQVFGTPFLVAMMEQAAFAIMQRALPEERSSVGTRVEVSHTAPTPLGMRVTARAEITAISENGKLVDFAVSAWDEQGSVAEGTHQRAVIHVARFLDKAGRRRGEG